MTNIYIENVSTNKVRTLSLLEYTKFVIEKANEGYMVFVADEYEPEVSIFLLGKKKVSEEEYLIYP